MTHIKYQQNDDGTYTVVAYSELAKALLDNIKVKKRWIGDAVMVILSSDQLERLESSIETLSLVE